MIGFYAKLTLISFLPDPDDRKIFIYTFVQGKQCPMQLQAVDTIETISSADFRNQYYLPGKPLVIKGAGKELAGLSKMELGFFIDIVGDKEVGCTINVKSDAYTAINTADGYMKFGDYLRKGEGRAV